MSATQTILKKIFRNPEQELIFFDDISVIDIYKKEAGRFYLKSLSNGNEERLVYNEKTGKSAPEEIVRQLFLSKLIKHYKYL